MKPVHEIQKETAEILGEAVAVVARRAIDPALSPFTDSISSLVRNLEEHAETFSGQVQSEKRALEALGKQLNGVVGTVQTHTVAAAGVNVQLNELRERLDSLVRDLVASRGEQTTIVTALNSLREEVLGWMTASEDQEKRLVFLLERSESLADKIAKQTMVISEFSTKLSVQMKAYAADGLKDRTEVSGELVRHATEWRRFFEAHFEDRETALRASIRDFVQANDKELKTIIEGIAAARLAGSNEIAAFGAAQQARAEVEGMGMKAEIHNSLKVLETQQSDHRRELAKVGEATGRVFRLVAAILVLVCVACTVSGVALWMASK